MYKHHAKVGGISAYQLLEEETTKLKLGKFGLLALDWWNGYRTPLIDVKLSGVLLGTTLGMRLTFTRAHQSDRVWYTDHRRDV